MDSQDVHAAMRVSMFKKLILVSVGMLTMAIASSAAYAQSTDDNRLDDAWKAALEDQEGLLTPQQNAALNNIAYQAAVARVCSGFEIDPAKYAKAVNDIVVPGSDKRSDKENLERQAGILISLGTAYGLFLAEGTAKKDDFCANASEFKDDKEMTHLWQ
jgi:hypothetical protein